MHTRCATRSAARRPSAIRSDVRGRAMTRSAAGVGVPGGGRPTEPYQLLKGPLNIEDAEDLLSNPDMARVITEAPTNPRGGELYIYSSLAAKEKMNDWKCDGYSWRNNSSRNFPINNPRLKKMYFCIRNKSGVSTSFCKFAITFIDNPYLVVIWYQGNESTAPKLKHGNRKNNNREHKRTYPSVISSLKSELVHEPPNKLYKTLVTKEEVGQRQGIANPRNLKQLHNLKHRQDAKLKLGNDDIANLYELTMHLGGYVKIIDLWPEFTVILMNDDLLKELSKLLDVNNADIVLSYDTNFNLGDFYVSVLSFRHTIFKTSKHGTSPTIPVAFMIHDRKKQKCIANSLIAEVQDSYCRCFSTACPRCHKCCFPGQELPLDSLEMDLVASINSERHSYL